MNNCPVTLIYCANGNRRFADIAAASGYRIGAQLPGTVYHPVYFADQDWKKPNRTTYMAALATHRPQMATVLDWEQICQLPEVLEWAEEASAYTDHVVIIPKVVEEIGRIPRTIGGKPVVLGYSVPTRYGATPCCWWEFEGRQVHLLGGSPHAQMREWDYLRRVADVVSADGNMINLAATRHCKYWQQGKWVAITPRQSDAPYEAFRRSCENIQTEWKRLQA